MVTITVPSGELGTPFNAEIERLRELVRIGSLDGVQVGLKTETGRMSQDPNTAMVLCDNVKGLAITLDPSHFVFGPNKGANYDQIFKYVIHLAAARYRRRTSYKSASARARSNTVAW